MSARNYQSSLTLLISIDLLILEMINRMKQALADRHRKPDDDEDYQLPTI